MHEFNYESEKRERELQLVTKKRSIGFVGKAAISMMAIVLGGISLGAGLGAGGEIFKFYTNTTVSAAQESIETIGPAVTRTANFGVTDIVKSVSDSVVSINLSSIARTAYGSIERPTGAGSGIIFAEDAEKVYIATNNHVISNAARVTISIDDNNQMEAHVVGGDYRTDLAVLYVDKTEMTESGIIDYKVATFGDSENIEVGESVVAIGNALGEGKIATQGIISAINKNINIDGLNLNVIQTDAAINPGNSGGALVNMNGEIIGINTAKLSTSGVEGMGYSIPSGEAKEILKELMEKGTVERPLIGISGITINDRIRELYSLPSKGVYVSAVQRGYGAYDAGIQEGDIIISFNDKSTATLDDLTDALASAKIGDIVEVTVYRGANKTLSFDVTLKK